MPFVTSWLVVDFVQGTWQFISAVLLAFPGCFQYAVWHDLESFIHVLHWMCLRFHLTNKSGRPAKFSECIRQLYDACESENGHSVGGEDKLKFLTTGTIPFDLQGGSSINPNEHNGLYHILLMLADLYGEHYKLLQPLLRKLQAPKAEGKVELYKEKPSYHVGPGKRVTARSKRFLPGSSALHGAATPSKTTTSLKEPDMSASPFNHDEVAAAFYTVLEEDPRPWAEDSKQGDQLQRIAGLLKQGSKRRSDSSWEDSSGKRSRGSGDDVRSATATGTPQLGSISEGVENVFEG